MPRSGTGTNFDEWRAVGRKGTRLRVESIDQQLIQSEISGKDELIVDAGLNFVRVGRRLALFVYAGASMLDKRGARTEAAILFDREYCDVPAVVVRDQKYWSVLSKERCAGPAPNDEICCNKVNLPVSLSIANALTAPVMAAVENIDLIHRVYRTCWFGSTARNDGFSVSAASPMDSDSPEAGSNRNA